MRRLRLRSGSYAKVDESEYDELNRYTWSLTPNGYAARSENKKGKISIFYMHRVVAKTPKGKLTDHINGDKLDNRSSNLRHCTNSQNQANRLASRINTSGSKGVTWNKSARKWQAQIMVRSKPLYLGVYEDALIAAAVYQDAARKHFGDFAATSI